MATKRPWGKWDLAYLDQDTIRELGDKFGPGGPLAFGEIVWTAQAAAYAGAPLKEQGRAALRWRAFAKKTFLTVETAKAIVAEACELEILEMVEEATTRVTVYLTKWPEWQARDEGAAARKRLQRARAVAEDDGFDL